MKLAILGAGGHGKTVADAAKRMEKWSKIFFFDDRWPQLQHVAEWQVLGDSAALFSSLPEYDAVIVGIGNNAIREAHAERLRSEGVILACVVHPSATVSQHCKLGSGNVVLAGSVLSAGATVGDNCIINIGALIDHDSNLGATVHVGPGAIVGSEANIGARTWLGPHACVNSRTSLPNDSIVSAGTVALPLRISP